MKSARLPAWFVLLWITALSVFLLTGLASIPFHPDESTQLYMSSDLRALITQPRSLFFDPEKKDDPRQSYRLLDAPLTRYLLGAGLGIAGLQPVAQDWDWSRTWDENRSAGALPEARQLLAGRLAVALTLPLSLIMIYICGQYLGGIWAGLLATLLLCLHALVLLHARRAMAEGALLLGTCAFLASLPAADRRPWLAGLAFGLAFNAKQSALILLPVGLLAVAWSAQGGWLPWRRLTSSFMQYLLSFGLLTLLLNPILWKQPVQAAQAAIQARRELLSEQVADVQRAMPQQLLETPGERVVVLLAHLYLAPPMFAEAGNYRAGTAAAEAEFLANPFHTLGRNLPGAGSLLGLTLFGLIAAARRAKRADPSQKRGLALFFLATLLQTLGLVLAVPLAWQRYVIPLVPLVCIWASLGLVWMGAIFRQLREVEQGRRGKVLPQE